MKYLTVMRTITNTKLTMHVGTKFRHVEFDAYSSCVNLLVEYDTNAPVHEVNVITLQPGMAIPDRAFFIGVIPSPFMTLYGVPDTE